VNVNNNVITYTTPIKMHTPKQPARKEEFKKALDDQTQQSKSSSNENVNKTNNKEEDVDEVNGKNSDKVNDENQNGNVKNDSKKSDYTITNDKVSTDIKDTTEEPINELNKNSEKIPKDLIGQAGNKIINALKKLIDLLKQNIKKLSGESVNNEKSTDEMAQMQQLLQSLTVMLQSIDKTTITKTSGTELNSINLEELIGSEKLTPETKSSLKNNLSEIVSLLEKSKGNNKMSTEMLGLLQKLTTEVKDTKSDLNLLKVPTTEVSNESSEDKSIKDNLIKMAKSQNTKSTSDTISKNQNQNQSSSDNKKDNKSSGNNSFEEKFLNKLLSGDKDDVKISKAVNFMNQFQTIKTTDAAKVLSANLVVNKNNFEADVIKSIKFMEINNMKDLTVKMNPRELGEITIKLTMESGIMKASILAQNKETYNLLNNNVQDIQDRLKNMDIKIQSLDINVYEDSTFFNKNSNENNNNGNGKQDKNSKSNMVIDDDIDTHSNYAVESNQVNKFV